MLNEYRYHKLAENSSPSGIEAAPFPIVGVQEVGENEMNVSFILQTISS